MDEADFTGANLAGACLHNAYLIFARLVRANLSNAVVREAWFIGADVTDAKYEGVDWSRVSRLYPGPAGIPPEMMDFFVNPDDPLDEQWEKRW